MNKRGQNRRPEWERTNRSRTGRPVAANRPTSKKARSQSSGTAYLVLFVLLIGLVAGTAFGVKLMLERFTEASSGVGQTPAETGPRTPPLDFTGFNPQHILDNERMLDWRSMDEAAIQHFLEQAGKGCKPGRDDAGNQVPCLAQYRTRTEAQPADRYCPRPFAAGANDSAAAVIAKSARACGINPQVLLVTLQKEQGLLTASGARLVPFRYKSAMGYDCPDHAKCNPRYAGFWKQVYFAAKQLQRYRLDPNLDIYQIKAGRENTISTGPDPSCKKHRVHVDNWATAALYNYTPYVPVPEAPGGIGGGVCDNPGNALFYAYLNAYFPPKRAASTNP